MTIDHLTNVIMAIGGLGLASFALVDATKALGGGISHRGFGFVKALALRLFGIDTASGPLTSASMLLTLRANWLNGGLGLADQKSVAKTLIKLRLSRNTAARLAAETGVDGTVLTSLADKYNTGEALTTDEQNVAGRFDLQLSAVLDEAYQRADQSYRNTAKAAAVLVAVVLALVGQRVLNDASITVGAAILAGLLAAPLAPISKDLASALQASAKALQSMKK